MVLPGSFTGARHRRLRCCLGSHLAAAFDLRPPPLGNAGVPLCAAAGCIPLRCSGHVMLAPSLDELRTLAAPRAAAEGVETCDLVIGRDRAAAAAARPNSGLEHGNLGANGQPTGKLPGSGGDPGIAAREAWGAWDLLGMDPISATV